MIEVLKGKLIAMKAICPEQSAMVEGWIVDAPGWSPLWHHYFVCVGHLRDLPGMQIASKRFTQATHELRVDALDPAKYPKPDDPKTWAFLSPPNVVWQFACDTDEQAAKACLSLVSECIGMDGHQSALCLETEGIRVNDMTAKEYWRERLKLVLPPGTRIE